MRISDWSSDVCSSDLVMFPDTKGGAQIRAIGPAAIRVLEARAEIAGNPHLFPSAVGDGPFTAVSACMKRVCGLAGIKGVTPHTLRHTFGRFAGDRYEEPTSELHSILRISYAVFCL